VANIAEAIFRFRGREPFAFSASYVEYRHVGAEAGWFRRPPLPSATSHTSNRLGVRGPPAPDVTCVVAGDQTPQRHVVFSEWEGG